MPSIPPVSVLEASWWLFFWTAFGLCIGSFLNVVIYRLPRDQSLRSPRWSACPYCRKRIRWYDNLPIISFILLGGRCRHCNAPIATRYVVVEAAMAMVVLVLFDAFFVGSNHELRSGLSSGASGLTDAMASDWPIFLAHIILFACLLSMSAVDLEHYWVDVRFTNVATLAGFLLHMIWTPSHSSAWPRPSDATSGVALLALTGLAVTWVVLVCDPRFDPEDFGEAPESEESGPTMIPRRPMAPLHAPPRVAGWLASLLLVGLIVTIGLDLTGRLPVKDSGRMLLPIVFFFLLIVSESTISRASDNEIVTAIEEEAIGARKMVLAELGLLLPAIVCGVLGFVLLRYWVGLPVRLHDALHDGVAVQTAEFLRGWRPLMGIATAATGFIIAGALGWAVRIVFTLVFGKEAFGTGDIHLMAAAGCVAGWPVVVIGFFLTCGLALVGWAMTLPFKRTRALPLGPWLSLSFLIVVVYYDPILALPVVARTIDAVHLLLL